MGIPHRVADKWSGDAVTQYGKSAYRFLPEHFENNWRKEGDGHTSRTCPVCGFNITLQHLRACFFPPVERVRQLLKASGCWSTDVHGLDEHWEKGPWCCSCALTSTLPTLTWCHLFCLYLLDLIMINPVQSARYSVPYSTCCAARHQVGIAELL